MARKKLLDPIHPGEILFEEFMVPMDVSINKLARNIGVSPGRISAIVNGSARLPPTPLFVWGNTWERPRNSGSDFRVSSISGLPIAGSGQKSRSGYRSTWPDRSSEAGEVPTPW